MAVLQFLWFPVLLILVFAGAFWYRSAFIKEPVYRKYFIPALALKIIGSLSLTLVYKYYYGYGDIFLYYQGGSIIFEGFSSSFSEGWKLLTDIDWMRFRSLKHSNIFHHYVMPSNYNVMRVTGIVALLGLNNLYAISLLFGTFSFFGMWAMFRTFIKIAPALHKEFAIACFFLPSVFFWGSGILKDSITISALGWVFWGFYNVVIKREKLVLSVMAFSLAAVTILNIKYYILFSFLPPMLYWAVNEYQATIKNKTIRVISTPFFLILAFTIPMFGIVNLMSSSDMTLDKLVYQSLYQKEHLAYSGAGSAYSLGEFDESLSGMLMIAPKSIFLALFRPFIWEVRNPLMLLSAFECMFFLYVTYKAIKEGLRDFLIVKALKQVPVSRALLVFTFVFAAGIGISSGNFGTLARYKIPFMPFYLAAIYMLLNYIRTSTSRINFSQGRQPEKRRLKTTPEGNWKETF